MFRWASSWRRVAPYLLARLLYQVRVLRSMVVLWSATSFTILSRSTSMAWVGASAGGMASRVWRAVASSDASMALRVLLGLGARRLQLSDLGRAGGVVVLIVGGFGSFDLGVEAGVFVCEGGSFG